MYALIATNGGTEFLKIANQLQPAFFRAFFFDDSRYAEASLSLFNQLKSREDVEDAFPRVRHAEDVLPGLLTTRFGACYLGAEPGWVREARERREALEAAREREQRVGGAAGRGNSSSSGGTSSSPDSSSSRTGDRVLSPICELSHNNSLSTIPWRLVGTMPPRSVTWTGTET